MPIKKLSTNFFGSTPREVMAVNGKIDQYNKTPKPLTLDEIQAYIDAVPRTFWVSRATEILALEQAVSKEKQTYKKGASGAQNLFGGGAAVDTTPTRWLEKLFPDAPALEGVTMDGTGKQGAQGNTHKLSLPNGKKLFAKTARGADKASVETETQREYNVYKKFYATVGGHDNLVKVWGWADIKLGIQHEVGFIMDHIEGPDGRTAQQWLKEAWDLGYCSSAEYWSSIQYIGRCHVSVITHLRSAGWAHNDIKPENYVIDANTGEVIVIDLGGAGKIGEAWNAVTVEYLSPEMRGPDGKANKAATGSASSDVFALGASLAHAAEAAHAFHSVAMPNRGLHKSDDPSKVVKKGVEGMAAGRYKNPFAYGVETDYTRQVNRMMNSNPLERDKVLDEHASNKFLYDSILTDEQARAVLKGIVSGSRKKAWEEKWRLSGKAAPTLMTVDKLSLATKLKDRMRPYSGLKNYGGADVSGMTKERAAREENDLLRKKKDLLEVAKIIAQANALGIDTMKDKKVINDKLKEVARMEQAIVAALGRPLLAMPA